MSYGRNSVLLNRYRQTAVTTSVEDASPHKLISLLFDGALERIAQAKGAIAVKDIAKKGEVIGKAVDIVNGLQAGLNMEVGGELAQRLASLYEYMAMRLVQANLTNDTAILDEVSRLIGEISSAWSAIPEEHRMQRPAGTAAGMPP